MGPKKNPVCWDTPSKQQTVLFPLPGTAFWYVSLHVRRQSLGEGTVLFVAWSVCLNKLDSFFNTLVMLRILLLLTPSWLLECEPSDLELFPYTERLGLGRYHMTTCIGLWYNVSPRGRRALLAVVLVNVSCQCPSGGGCGSGGTYACHLSVGPQLLYVSVSRKGAGKLLQRSCVGLVQSLNVRNPGTPCTYFIVFKNK